MPVFKGTISTDANFYINNTKDSSIESINISNQYTGNVDITLYIKDSKGFIYPITADPMTLKPGQIYTRDTSIQIIRDSQIYIKTTNVITYYITTSI